MAKVYRTVGGRPIAKIIALHQDVQKALDVEAQFAAQTAEGLLLEHVSQGHSSITTEQGNVDHYVILDDTRGLEAALSIEYGRKPKEDPETGEMKGGMEGLFVLHRAFSLERGSIRDKPKKGGDSLRD